MEKILKPYTIIPPDLYVHRDADRQVRDIITDMGRPGYVLVSRQMGKTNLLLNAKRELETSQDAFVYVDLSNPFDNPKSCFENIIDTAIETHDDKFSEPAKKIIERRKELIDTPPHKQHVNELRTLLKSISGKLVIIIDEIDALTKTNYSDQIFAQIRSIYFSRGNFPELARLTYILSGVIEPTEIIKDRKISPFNIGQKIFLNDFSQNEFEIFLKYSKLDLNNDIKDRIFYWTSGNPRMTWDVCSEVENKLNSDELSIEVIDDLIAALYLTTFDKPPIDNIREITKNDREIRNSIVEIEYQKGMEISDRIKSKLYLAGIINYEDKDIQIKNEIIRQSLNLDWIKFLEEDEKGLVKIAIEFFEKGNFKEALYTFERYLEGNEFGDDDKSLCNYQMGYAAYRNSDFKKALECFNQAVFDREDNQQWYYRVIYFKGLMNYFLGEFDSSLSFFKLVIDGKRGDDIYVRALLNYGSISLMSNRPEHIDEAAQIFNGIANEEGFDKSKLKNDFFSELKSIAYFNLAQINMIRNEIEVAKENFKKAVTLSSDNTKPTMILELSEITHDTEERSSLLQEIITLIIEDKIKPVESDVERPIDFTYEKFRDLCIMTYLHYQDTLFAQLKNKLNLMGEKTLAQHIFELAKSSNDRQTARAILLELYKHRENPEYAFNDQINYNSLKFLAYVTDASQSIDKHKEYIELLRKDMLEPIDKIDIVIFTHLIYTLTNQKNFKEALGYVDLFNTIKFAMEDKNLINYLVICNLELNLYIHTNDRKNAFLKAKEIKELANDERVKSQKSNLLGDSGLETIKQNAASILNPMQRHPMPLKISRKYGRNEIVKVRYRDGTVLEAKYKKVESDSNSGECFILE